MNIRFICPMLVPIFKTNLIKNYLLKHTRDIHYKITALRPAILFAHFDQCFNFTAPKNVRKPTASSFSRAVQMEHLSKKCHFTFSYYIIPVSSL